MQIKMCSFSYEGTFLTRKEMVIPDLYPHRKMKANQREKLGQGSGYISITRLISDFFFNLSTVKW